MPIHTHINYMKLECPQGRKILISKNARGKIVIKCCFTRHAINESHLIETKRRRSFYEYDKEVMSMISVQTGFYIVCNKYSDWYWKFTVGFVISGTNSFICYRFEFSWDYLDIEECRQCKNCSPYTMESSNNELHM